MRHNIRLHGATLLPNTTQLLTQTKAKAKSTRAEDQMSTQALKWALPSSLYKSVVEREGLEIRGAWAIWIWPINGPKFPTVMIEIYIVKDWNMYND